MEVEGDPQIRARIRAQQMEMARKRMLADVPRADVVITNPTHYAVALRYDELPEPMDDPLDRAWAIGCVKRAREWAERAIERRDEYAGIGMPMLPVTHGEQYTKLHILFYTLILLAISLMPFAIGMSGPGQPGGGHRAVRGPADPRDRRRPDRPATGVRDLGRAVRRDLAARLGREPAAGSLRRPADDAAGPT